jgi:hypothetical protein
VAPQRRRRPIGPRPGQRAQTSAHGQSRIDGSGGRVRPERSGAGARDRSLVHARRSALVSWRGSVASAHHRRAEPWRPLPVASGPLAKSTCSRRTRPATGTGDVIPAAAVARRELFLGRARGGLLTEPQAAAGAQIPDCISPARWQDSNTVLVTCRVAPPCRPGIRRVPLRSGGVARMNDRAHSGKRQRDSSSHY